KLRAASVLIILSLCSGCGTMNTHSTVAESHNPQGPYDGVRYDWHQLSTDHHVDSFCFYTLDLPFSAIGDTIFLPIDLRTPMSPGKSDIPDSSDGAGNN
ncbi:MAG TPA: YceK/YidQ family lipoprotein, partial [Verrucomicrobiae bacterium]|nr:YceK/YidQ family lipoprotein [Verrucomicrobiae bacterium]